MSTKIFGKYEVIRRLAVGGMGEIFLARQSGIAGFDRLAILKSLLPDLAQEESSINEFLDEARVAATLNHPNIVGIYEVGRWEGVYFIAMEYIRGESISGLMVQSIKSQTPVPLAVSVKIVRDAGKGLAHAHSAVDLQGKPLNIIHRDISPQNIMVRDDGVSKVVDFGIARAANRLTRTSTGLVKGKIGYMAPEQVRGGELDSRTDQYALGIVLWEMAVGRRRIDRGMDQLSVLKAICDDDIPPPSSVNPEVPALLDAIVVRMAARDRSARYASSDAAVEALQAFLDESYPTETGINDVADFVATAVGDELADRTKDLTPTGENFMVSLTDRSTEPIGASQFAVPVAPAPKRRRLAVVGLVAGFIALGIVAAWALGIARQPSTATQSTVAPDVPTPVSGPADLELEIRGPKGARVFIDERLWGERAPTVITGLAPGPHSVRLELPGKRAIVRRVRMRRGRAEVIDRSGRVSAAETPEVEIVSVPEGAVVRVGQMILGMTPLTTSKLAADAKHKINIELDGYEAKTIQIELAAGERKRIEVTLQAKKIAPRASRASRGKRRATSGSARAPPAPAADGFLTIETKPWTKVSIDGRARGVTTLFKMPLRPGTHEVRMVNEGAGIDETRQVKIGSGAVTKLKLTLSSK